MLRPRHYTLSAIILGIIVSGCDVMPDTIGFNRGYPPPSATGQYDGSYHGRSRLVRGENSAVCPQERIGVVEVGDKRLSFAYTPTVIFNPPIDKDGKIHDQVGSSILDGKFVNRDLLLTVKTPQCETAYDLTLIGNRS